MEYNTEDMRAYFEEREAEKIVLARYDDYVNSKLFAGYFMDRHRYVRERKCWYYYENGIWQPDVGDLTVTRSAKVLGRTLLNYAADIESDALRQNAVKVAARWQSLHHVQTLIRFAACEFPLSVSDFDANPYLLNFRNGTLDLQTMQFRPHSSYDLITKMMNAEYDPSVSYARFNLFVAEIMQEDTEMIRFLSKALGYALDGVCREECLFILYGASTRNGKSTLMESVMEVMGSYGCAAEPETLARRSPHAAGPSEDVARLKGVRLVGIAEPDKSLVFNASRVKTLTGNDTVNARFLHENSFQFRPEATFFINTNHLPQVTDITLFTSNRLHVIPFERHFAPSEQQKDLKQVFRTDKARSAIASFLVNGYHLWKLEGLTPPDKVKRAAEEYLAASDRVKQFLNDRLTPCEGGSVTTAEAYAQYRVWCAENGYQPYAQNKFSESLKRYCAIRRLTRGGSQAMYLLDFVLKPNLQDLQD